MKFKCSKISFLYSTLLFIGIVIFLCFKDNTSPYLCLVYSLETFVVIICSFYVNYKKKDLFSFINISNLFLLFVFVFRPIQLLLNYNEISKIYAISLYKNIVSNSISIQTLPLAQASFIGFLGIGLMNISFFWKEDKQMLQGLSKAYKSDSKMNKLSVNNILVIIFFLLISLVSLVSFIKNASMSRNDVGIFDIIWLFIMSILIIYVIYLKRKTTFIVYILMILSFMLLSVLAKRQYMVNLMLCYIISLYYMGRNRKKNIKIIGMMCILVFIVVLIYGSIRSNMISSVNESSALEKLMDEFCMYDMLVVSLKRLLDSGHGFYLGYNFLTIFTTPIPGISIPQFDHELTHFVFKGMFKGGIPVTLIGSFYLNFSYVGIFFLSILTGRIFKYIQNIFSKETSSKNIIYYTIFSTFVYDVIRVGDIGRELWTLLFTLAICFAFNLLIIEKREKTHEE